MKFWFRAQMTSILPSWWDKLDYFFLILSFVAVYHASSHAVKGLRLYLWLFWACLATAIIFEAQLHWMAYIASAGLIITHFVNIRRHLVLTKRHRAVAEQT